MSGSMSTSLNNFDVFVEFVASHDATVGDDIDAMLVVKDIEDEEFVTVVGDEL